MEKLFYRCDICGNTADMLVSSKAVPICCGQPMEKLVANTVDAAKEKHVPAFTLAEDKLSVQIGDTTHPMEEAHHIEWIMVVQGAKSQVVRLAPGEEPKAAFVIEPGKKFEVYEHCNLHGLWKKEG